MSSRQEAMELARAKADTVIESMHLGAALDQVRAVYDQSKSWPISGVWLIGPVNAGWQETDGRSGMKMVAAFTTHGECRAFIARLSERCPDMEALRAMKLEHDAEDVQWVRDFTLAREGLLTTVDANRPGVRAGEFARGLFSNDAPIGSRPADPLHAAVESGLRSRHIFLAKLARDEPGLSTAERTARLGAWMRENAEAQRAERRQDMSKIEARRSRVDKPEPA